jgi:hypothetical protein
MKPTDKAIFGMASESPGRNAELFVRLQGELPGVFPDGQLRTFQRRVREWRHAAARQLVFASPSEGAA